MCGIFRHFYVYEKDYAKQFWKKIYFKDINGSIQFNGTKKQEFLEVSTFLRKITMLK